MLAHSLSCALALAAAAGPAPGPPASDSVLAERYGREIVAAINDTSLAPRAVREVFAGQVRAGGDEERTVRLFGRLAASLGRLEYHHSEISLFRGEAQERRTLHVYARTADRGWKDFQFSLEADPPHRALGRVFIADVTEPVYLPPAGLEQPSVRRWLHEFVDRQARVYGLSGAALVAFGDSVVFERYFGTEDVAGRRPVTAATRFSLGSGNKMFTAIAIARLVAANRLSYRDSIAKFFPDFPDPERARRITVHDLLNHTSGWGEIWTEDWLRDSRGFTRLEQHLPYVYRVGPLGAVGERHYCNSNFILAGLIVERVTGRDYFDHIRETLTAPLGLAHTDSYFGDSLGPGFAEPMVGEPGRWRRGVVGRRGTSAGGGYSTPRDMLAFARALQRGGVVDRAILRTLVEPKPATGAEDDPYGYGFSPIAHGATMSFGHGGIAPGVNFELRVFPREDATVVVFSNQDNGAFDDLKKVILRLVSGQR